MPGGFPIGLEMCAGTSLASDTGTAYGTAVTASGSTNTKGSWTQLTASSAIDAAWMLAQFQPTAAAYKEYAVDIGVGGAGSEVVIASNLYFPCANVISFPSPCFLIPCQIPAGTRIAARCQSTTASAAVGTTIQLFDAAFQNMEGAGGIEAVGFTAGSTTGTTLTSGTADTKGSYAQLVASTSKDYLGFSLALMSNAFGTVSAANALDIAIGGAGSEQIIVPDFVFQCANTYTPDGFVPALVFWIPIPSGTRIAARVASHTASSGYKITLNGIYV